MADKPTIELAGINQLLRVLKALPKDLQNETREASQSIANDLVSAATAAAHTPLQRFAASGLKARRDRIPVVATGGTLSPGTRARDVFYGAEFGGQRRPTTRQFQPHMGQRGYWFYPTARAHGKEYVTQWGKAIDKAFADWDYRAKG